MQIETLDTKIIKCKDDTCRVSQTTNFVALGSVTIQKSEAAEFIEALRQAFSEMGVIGNTGQEKA